MKGKIVNCRFPLVDGSELPVDVGGVINNLPDDFGPPPTGLVFEIETEEQTIIVSIDYDAKKRKFNDSGEIGINIVKKGLLKG